MSEHEKENGEGAKVESNLPYALKLAGCVALLGLLIVPPLWACVRDLNVIGMFICACLSHVVTKLYWSVC